MDSVLKGSLKVTSFALALLGCIISTQSIADTTTTTAPKRTVNLMPVETVLGLVVGFTSNNRAGTVDSAVVASSGGTPGNYRASSSNTSHDAEAGLQLKLVYDLYGKAQPFIYMNVLGTVGASNTINVGLVNPTATSATSLVVSYDWLAHIGLGVQTEPLWGQLQFGAGLGAAFLNQAINAYISEITPTTFTNHHFSATGTLMADMSWKACSHCIADNPFSMSLQVTADRMPSLAVNGTTPSGNTYMSNVNAQWIPRVDLVFNVLAFG